VLKAEHRINIKMKDSTKNMITNIIGLILLVFNTYEFYFDEFTLLEYAGGLVISLALFLFKGTETKQWLRKALSKYSS
jgi:hypothetical protein